MFSKICQRMLELAKIYIFFFYQNLGTGISDRPNLLDFLLWLLLIEYIHVES